jgi:environmental stress-induced protein Ves
MRIIRFRDIQASSWINGGGSVKVIAAGVMDQEGRPLVTPDDGWHWRLSIADVGQAGSFSVLSGVNRILTVVEGGPLQLTIDGKSLLVPAQQPLGFDGSSITAAALPAGPVRNLNLMYRDGRVEGSVSIISLGEQRLLPHQAAVLLAGDAQVDDAKLHRFDTVFGSEEAAATVLRGKGTLALVEVRHAESA